MHPLYEKADALTKVVVDAAVAVHSHFGPGLLESVYVKCLEQALRVQGHKTAREVAVPIEQACRWPRQLVARYSSCR